QLIPAVVAATSRSENALSNLTVTVMYPFFFQAEDGIRDRNVTGVQTCALPICIDAEGRVGVSDRADVGVRIPSGSGIVVTYKYRLSKNADHRASAIAIMGGGGFVNWGNHAHFETTLIASGHQSLLTPYGGLRLAQVVPLSRSARSHSPTAGGFFGLPLGKGELGVSAEVGVFYERSAPGV